MAGQDGARVSVGTGGRLDGLDALRVVVVFCVIALHAAMTYMAYVPQWWYVIDPRNSLFFTILVVFLDSFPMTTLFFLSGYFSPPSLAKRTRGAFISDKLRHIGIPWVLGVLLVAPFFAAATMKAYLPLPSAAEFMRTEFFGRFYQQGHYWYLGILLFFQIVYALAVEPGKALPKNLKPGAPGPARLISILALSMACFFLSVRYVKPVDDWLNVGYVLYFQPARIVGYVLIFALGVYGCRRRWFTPGGWTPSLVLWGTLAAVSSCAMLYWKFAMAPALGATANAICNAVLYNLVAFSIPLFLSSLFMRVQGSLLKLGRRFGPTSYGTYWLHQIVLMPALYVMLNLGLPIGLKWAVGIVATITICQVLTNRVLKKIPGKIF